MDGTFYLVMLDTKSHAARVFETLDQIKFYFEQDIFVYDPLEIIAINQLEGWARNISGGFALVLKRYQDSGSARRFCARHAAAPITASVA